MIKYGAEAHRRRMPYNMGSLYWQLDDCWPVASWSGIDYYGRWKALHYAARRFFAPVLVSPVEENGDVRVYVVSDRRTDLAARLTVRLVDMEGRERWKQERDVTVKALTSAAPLAVARRELLKGIDPSQVVLVAEVRAGAELIARNLLYFVKTKDLALQAPGLAVAVTPHGAGATIRVTARRLARAVWLSTPDGQGVSQGGIEGGFSDNFFDLLAGETATVEWIPGAATPAGAAANLGAALRAVSVRDTY